MESGDDELASQLTLDYRAANLGAQDRALCDFAIKLTLMPTEMTERDVARLRDHGLSDVRITVATQVVSYFNYINRIADGLGVDAETWMTVPPDTWHQKRGRDFESTLRKDET